MNLGIKSILFAIMMIVLACSFPVSAHGESSGTEPGAASAAPTSEAVEVALDEIEEHANELLEITGIIHDESEYIADDDTLSEEIRAAGEEIHLSSHDMEHCVEKVLAHVGVLRVLVGDIEANGVSIEKEIGEINRQLEECTGIIESDHDKLHELMEIIPESHVEYANRIHDYYHEAEDLADHILEHVDELEEAIKGSVLAADIRAAPGHEVEAAAKTGSENSAPGFGIVLAVAGLLCMIFITRRK